MRRIAIAAAIGFVGASAAAPAAPPAPADNQAFHRPVIVSRIDPVATAAPAATSAPVFESEVQHLSRSIEDHQKTLDQLQTQLEEGFKQKRRLVLAQKLVTAIIALHRAERTLADVEDRVTKAKDTIKKFGNDAEDIADAIKRSETDHRKELIELNKRLGELKENLGEQEGTLADLSTRRDRISAAVKKWKEHVATLKDAHELAIRPPGLRTNTDDITEPPADIDFTNSDLIPGAYTTIGSSQLQLPNLSKYLDGKASSAQAIADIETVMKKIAGQRFAKGDDEDEDAGDARSAPRFASVRSTDDEEDATQDEETLASLERELNAAEVPMRSLRAVRRRAGRK